MYPWHFVAADLPASPLWILLNSWPSGIDRFIFRDIVVNVALYVPAGIAGHLAFRKAGKFWPGILAPTLVCAVWSATIEMVQLFVPPRDCSALDLTTNIAGAVAGVFLGVALEDVFLRHPARIAAQGRPDRSALALIVSWVIWLLFPLFPVMGRTVLVHKFAAFAHSAGMDPVPVLSMAMVWFAAGELLRAGAVRYPHRIVAIAVALIPAQFFIVDRQPVLSEFAGAIAGAACFALFRQKLPSGRRSYRNALAWSFLIVVVVRGLAPFHFLDTAGPFSWIPFGGFLNMNWQTGVQVIAEKFFWYGTAIWLMPGAGTNRLRATALVAAALLGIEIAQMYLPGHVAEVTDPLMAIFASFALAILARAKHRTGQTAQFS